MKGPGDEESEPPGGRAAERLREFQRQRLPPDATPEEIQAEAERLAKEAEEERSRCGPNKKPDPSP
jgi:hypothetical protein